jgi:hypothetical protein
MGIIGNKVGKAIVQLHFDPFTGDEYKIPQAMSCGEYDYEGHGFQNNYQNFLLHPPSIQMDTQTNIPSICTSRPRMV